MRGPAIRIGSLLLIVWAPIACRERPSGAAAPEVEAAKSATTAQAQRLSPEDLTRRTIERRAVEAVIWGMPAVNQELMFQAMKGAGADFNQVVYWRDAPGRRNAADGRRTIRPAPARPSLSLPRLPRVR